MSCSLNSLKGGYIGDYIGDYYRGIKGDTRSLDNGSYSHIMALLWVAGVTLNPQTPENFLFKPKPLTPKSLEPSYSNLNS